MEGSRLGHSLPPLSLHRCILSPQHFLMAAQTSTGGSLFYALLGEETGTYMCSGNRTSGIIPLLHVFGEDEINTGDTLSLSNKFQPTRTPYTERSLSSLMGFGLVCTLVSRLLLALKEPLLHFY